MRIITTLFLILICGCNNQPKPIDKVASDFLDELKFTDRNSMNIIKCDRDDRGVYAIVFTSKSIDFTLFERNLSISSSSEVGYIEQISTYRFRNPGLNTSACDYKTTSYGTYAVYITSDGEFFVVSLMFQDPACKRQKVTEE